MVPHRRQFVAGPTPCGLVPSWRHTRLGDRWLSYSPELPVTVADDADGQRWAILGRAVESRRNAPDPAEQIAAAGTSGVSQLYDGWTGRWVLVGARELHLDATGQLGCYVGRTADGTVWASSSPSLAARLTANGVLPRAEPWSLRYEDPISWVVPPRSRFPSVARLLPSQVLILADGSVRQRQLLCELGAAMSPEERVGLIADALGTALKHLACVGPVRLALTAGADSRMMLAAAHGVEGEVTAFTRLSPRMSLADRLLPPRLAAAAGLDHSFVGGTLRRRNAWELVREHTGGHVGAGDANPFVRGERAGLEGLCVGGWGSGVGRDYRTLPSSLSESTEDTERLARLLRVYPGSRAHAALSEWVQWAAATPEPALELRDRFTIEQRQAGWLAAKEQLYDLDRLERINLLNARRTVSLLLSVPEAVRVSRSWQYDLVKRAAPELADFPWNPPDRHFGLARAAGRRLRHPLAAGNRFGRRARRAARSIILAAR